MPSVRNGEDQSSLDSATPQVAPGVDQLRPTIPSGLWGFIQLAAFHQRPVDPDQLVLSLGLAGQPFGIPEILMAAAEIGLKAKAVAMDWERITKLKQPAMAHLQSGEFVIVGHLAANGQLPVLTLGDPRPALHDRTQWEGKATGNVILIRERLAFDNPNRPFGLGWFVPVLRKYRRELVEVLLAAFLYQLLGMGIPLFVQVIIDKVFVYQNYATLVVVSVGMLIVIVFNGIFALLQSLLLSHAGNRIDVTLGSAVYRRLVRIPLRYFEQRRVGDTTARVREMESLRSFLTGQALLSLIDGVFVFAYVALLLLYSTKLTGVVLLIMLALVINTALFRPALKILLEDRFDQGANSQAFLVESVTGMETVKSMALEAHVVRRWDRLLAQYVTSCYRADRLASVARSIGTTLQSLMTLAVLWFGAQDVLGGHMTVGALIAFQMLAGRAMAPMLRISSMWQQFQQAGISMRRIGDLMNAPVEPVLDASRSNPPPLQGHIRLENVSFRYLQESPRVLEGIDFEIKPGSTVGVVGRSGSGKSTLAKLLLRLYVPEQGRLLIDGHDLQQVDPNWLRQQIAVVPQESFLFNGTLRENIAIRMPSAPIGLVVHAAKLAGAHDFIAQLPQGYDTPVGERGTSLSGGQRQRVAIARALLTNPRVLIFDEATSALDYESERIIQENLGKIAEGRTLIIIAHRMSILRHADQILVLDQGRLKEAGNHRHLLDQAGLYKYLYQQQGLAA